MIEVVERSAQAARELALDRGRIAARPEERVQSFEVERKLVAAITFRVGTDGALWREVQPMVAAPA